MTSPFLERLRAAETTLMLGIRASRTTDVVRMAASTGHHAILVDLEHSAMSVQTATELCAAAHDLGLRAFVRTPERDYGVIGRLLDGGAHGIVAPRVESSAEASMLARACRFPPVGQRSQLASLPMFGMKPTPARVLNPTVNASTVVQVIVETPAGVDAADEIAAVDGVDILVMGANDFTAELGRPGDYGHPDVRDAVAIVAQACQRHGKLFMLAGIGDRAIYDSLAALGACPLLLTGMDSELLYSAMQQRAESLLTAPVETP
jgi:2-keto-3-deoxy-L-rhamnonate aldolase RhmA